MYVYLIDMHKQPPQLIIHLRDITLGAQHAGVYIRDENHELYQLMRCSIFRFRATAQCSTPEIDFRFRSPPLLVPSHDPPALGNGVFIHATDDTATTQVGLRTLQGTCTQNIPHIQTLELDLRPDSRVVKITMLRTPSWTNEMSFKIAELGGIEVIVEEIDAY